MVNNEIDPYIIQKNQLKINERLNVVPETTELLQENIRENVLGIGIMNDLLDIAQKLKLQKKN